ncbi:MAG: thiamine pyrophosphate-dependent dehydrogenase E1 component subunit alpha [Acidimicrobiales bacterium]
MSLIGEPNPLERRDVIKFDRLARLGRMIEIRRVEEAIQQLFAEGAVRGTTHTAQGQEAVSVALAAATEPSDSVTCTYRGHGVALALGMKPETLLAEVLGRSTGAIGGVGGSMHLCDRSIGLMPTFAIVGAGIPVAVGAGLSSKILGSNAIAVAVFGDGATNIGAFHESMNLARVWELPVLFLCENNLYGEYSRIDRTTPFEDLHRRGGSYDMDSRSLDGQEVESLTVELQHEVDQIRATSMPRFVEVKTYRFAGHSRSDPATYRPEGELDKWLKRDPIALASAAVIADGLLDEGAVEALDKQVSERVTEAVGVAVASPEPALKSMFENVKADS